MSFVEPLTGVYGVEGCIDYRSMWLPPSVKDKAIAVDSERLNQAVSCVLCAADGACDENELSVALKMIVRFYLSLVRY